MAYTHSTRRREYFTKQLERLFERLDRCDEQDVELVPPDLPWLGLCKGHLRVISVWVYGSYRRGALRCGDVDLIVQAEGERYGDTWTPELSYSKLRVQLLGRLQNVQLHVGTPDSHPGGLVEAPDSLLLWKRGMKWREALSSIQPDPAAGRMPRLSDQLPLDRKRIGVTAWDADELVHARDAGLLQWRFVPFPEEEPDTSELTEAEDQDYRGFASSNGFDAQRAYVQVLIALRTCAAQINLRTTRIGVRKYDWGRSQAALRIANAGVHVSDFTENGLRVVVAVPFVKRGIENGLWIVEPGPNFRAGVESFTADMKAREAARSQQAFGMPARSAHVVE